MTIAHKLVGHGPVKVIALHGWFGTSEGWGMLPSSSTPTPTRTRSSTTAATAPARTRPASTRSRRSRRTPSPSPTSWAGTASPWSDIRWVAPRRCACWRTPGRVTAVVGISPVPASGVPFDADSEALFTGAENEDGNRYAILDFTTGNGSRPRG